FSGMGTNHGCIITSKVSASAKTSTQSTPRKPMRKPLKIAATGKETPLAAPTIPFALSLVSSGIRMVTRTESAMGRMFPAIAPISVSSIKPHKGIAEGSAKTASGVDVYITNASRYRHREQMLEISIAVFFLKRSTREPRKNPDRATVPRYTPAITEVASTDFVCRYTQKVTANHTTVLVSAAVSERSEEHT